MPASNSTRDSALGFLVHLKITTIGGKKTAERVAACTSIIVFDPLYVGPTRQNLNVSFKTENVSLFILSIA